MKGKITILLSVLAALTGNLRAESLRALSTDRPDQTESPFTVDAGHAQLEMDLVTVTRDTDRSGGGNVRTTEHSWAPFNLKYGVTADTGLHLMFDPLVRVETEDRVAGTTQRESGAGDVTIRLKHNLWGNDGGPTAFGLLPWVKLPLSGSEVRNGKTEFGLILPYAVELSGGWGMGAQVGIARVRDDNLETVTSGVVSVVCGRDVTDSLGVYLEIFAQTDSGPDAHWQVQFDCGLTYVVNANLQFDAGCNFGVTKAAPDWQPFVGISRRF
ncbi:MAG: transporter [Opitutaceae bacterium]|nr:transporter [Opitutaceae bacterium]